MLTREKIINGIYSCEHNTGYEHLDPVKVQNLADAILAEMEEPLAVLADRKGMCIVPQKFLGAWYIGIVTVGMKERHIEIEFKAPTYAEAEAKARQYLNTLKDKGEKI